MATRPNRLSVACSGVVLFSVSLWGQSGEFFVYILVFYARQPCAFKVIAGMKFKESRVRSIRNFQTIQSIMYHISSFELPNRTVHKVTPKHVSVCMYQMYPSLSPSEVVCGLLLSLFASLSAPCTHLSHQLCPSLQRSVIVIVCRSGMQPVTTELDAATPLSSETVSIQGPRNKVFSAFEQENIYSSLIRSAWNLKRSKEGHKSEPKCQLYILRIHISYPYSVVIYVRSMYLCTD